MTTTKTKARVRAVNLYTVECDGQPVAQAEAISQAEAVALWVASQQQPVLAARLATPRESRDLAHLPLLSRGWGGSAKDTATSDLFEAAPVSAELARTEEVLPPAQADATTQEGRTSGELAERGLMDEHSAQCPVVDAEWAPSAGDVAPVTHQVEEPADCLDAVPTAVESAGACSAVAELASPEYDELRRQAAAAAERRALGGKVAAMYRDPATGQTWSGRGLKPKWLVEAIEAGKSLVDFVVGSAA